MAVMPMFPLGLTLLPGAVLPLNVFEPRYLQMFREILSDDVNEPEFGVALITKGRDAGGGDERAMLATSARILDMQATDDGRYVLAAVGADRLRISAWLPDDPYPVADVDVWRDDDVITTGDDIASRVSALHERVDDLNDIARALGDAVPERTEISDDPVLAAYHLGSLAPLGPADRFALLSAPGLSARLDVLDDALDDVAAVFEFRRS